MSQQAKRRSAFSLVELSVVVIIIGVMAAFGLPRYMRSVERTKAGEAFYYLGAVRSAQERYQLRQGIYADDVTKLDIVDNAPFSYFTAGPVSAGGTGSLEDSWQITLTRVGAAAGYGAYTVTFNQDGYDPATSTIEVLSEINPRSTP